jgi:serine/threonine protein kinase
MRMNNFKKPNGFNKDTHTIFEKEEMDEVNEWSFLHPCSEIERLNNPNTEIDENCFEKIKTKYPVGDPKVLGDGSQSTVFELKSDDGSSRIAVKLIPYILKLNSGYPKFAKDGAAAELIIACKMNELVKMKLSPCFVHTYGFLVCKDIPKDWKDKLANRANFGGANDEYLNSFQVFILMFMELPQYKFDSKSKTDNEKYQISLETLGISVFYLLTHAIYMANVWFGLTHNDIAPRNILFLRNGKASSKIGSIDIGIEYPNEPKSQRKDISVPFYATLVPKIIDFSMSSWDKFKRDTQGDDFKAILTTLATRTDIVNQPWFDELNDIDQYIDETELQKKWRRMNIGEPDNQRDFFEDAEMWKENGLDLIIVDSSKKQRTDNVEKCIFCHSDASIMYENLPDYKFCNTYCAQTLGYMAMFIRPKKTSV